MFLHLLFFILPNATLNKQRRTLEEPFPKCGAKSYWNVLEKEIISNTSESETQSFSADTHPPFNKKKNQTNKKKVFLGTFGSSSLSTRLPSGAFSWSHRRKRLFLFLFREDLMLKLYRRWKISQRSQRNLFIAEESISSLSSSFLVIQV